MPSKKKGKKSKEKEKAEKEAPEAAAENEDELEPAQLTVVEVLEVTRKPKLPADHVLVSVFDGEAMFNVVTSLCGISTDDLLVFARPGCVLPSNNVKVSTHVVGGVKSEGHICTAFDVGWAAEETTEALVLEEDWNVISGDTCPMAPVQGWLQQQESRAPAAPEPEPEARDDADLDEDPEDAAEAGEATKNGRKEAEAAAGSGTKGKGRGGKGKGKGARGSGGFASLLDDEEGDEEGALGPDESGAAASKASGGPSGPGKKDGKSKGQGSGGFAALLDDEDDEAGTDDDEEAAAVVEPKVSAKGGKKGGKGKGSGSGGFAALLDEDESEEGEDQEREAPDVQPPKASAKGGRKGGKQKGQGSGGFAALLDDSDAEEDESNAASAESLQPKGKGGQKGGKAEKRGSASFAALLEEEEDDGGGGDDDDDVAAARPAGKKGNAGKKAGKGGGGSGGFAALLDEDDEAGDAADGEAAAAGRGSVGKEKHKQKGGKGKGASGGFAALLDDEDEDGDEGDEEETVAAPKAAAKADGKGGKRASGGFAALLDDEEEEEGDDAGKDGSADAEEEDRQGTEPAPQAAPSKKKDKKKKAKQAAAFDALLEDDDEAGAPADDVADSPAPAAPATPEPPQPAGGAGGKKKKGKSKAQELAEIDAILAEVDGTAPAAAPAPAAAAPTDSAAAGAGEEVPVNSLTTVEEVQAAIDAPGISKSRKQKLKQRLKQLQGPTEEAGKAAAAGKDQPSKPAKSEPEKPGKGGKPKKVSAAVLAMQQAVEERRLKAEAEERAREERRRAEEAARLAAEEEARRLEEERAAKAAAKAAKLEQLKKEGKLKTKKQKEEEARLQKIREQFAADAENAKSEQKLTMAEQQRRQRLAKQRKKEQQQAAEREERERELAELQKRREAEAEAKRKQEEEEARRAAAEREAAAAAQQAAPADDLAAWDDDVPDAWDAESDAGDAAGAPAASAQTVEAAAGKDAKADSNEDDEDGEEDDEDDDDEEEDSDEDSDSDDSDDDSEDSEEERERRLEEARRKREERFKTAMTQRSKDHLRSPICCILGHVDTGKTKILDNIRSTNVQGGEAGGITQQIGATYIPADAVQRRTEDLRAGKPFDMKMPGILVIDTPGHESFSNLRQRGSSLCDLAVLVVDVMHGLEQQTIESIKMLRSRKAPFVIALNKIDRSYAWRPNANAPVRASLEKQGRATQQEFESRCAAAMLALNEQGLNVELYWKNKDPRRFVSIVPTSAITGEGICDLMWLIVRMTQTMMVDRLMFVEELQCTVLEVKVVEGYGHTIDAVLINGRIREGDKIVVCGLQGPIVTTIRSLLTPHPLKELRVKNTYIHHKEIQAAQGIKIAAPNLESAVAGTTLYVLSGDDDEDELRELVMEDMSDIFDKKESEGVCVQASTLGSLEALLEFLGTDAVQIPVSGMNIGPVHKKDIMRAAIMSEKGLRNYACLLAFDVPVSDDMQAFADRMGVRVFTADIIYHLFDRFVEYTKECKARDKEDAALEAVFPCILKILPDCVFNAKDPIVVGCEVADGQLRIGTPITVPSKDNCDLGRVAGLEKDHKAVEKCERGDKVAVKIESTNGTESSRLYGRHFDSSDDLVSKISRESINALKAHFRDEMTRPDWELVIRLKKVFKID